MPDQIEQKKPGDVVRRRFVSYWAAHEQYSVHDLLKFVVEAEKNVASAPQWQMIIFTRDGTTTLSEILLGCGLPELLPQQIECDS